MEVEDDIETQVCKFQRIASNGSTTSDNNSSPQKIATQKGNLGLQNLHNHHYSDDYAGAGGGGGGVARLCGWPSSRIVRVSRASGGKDRHSKVLTSKGPRDRRVRLSVTTAIQFYDLQDRLGYDQPSKAVEWLLKAAASSIDELPSLDPSFSGAVTNHGDEKGSTGNNGEFEDLNQQISHTQQVNNNNLSLSKSSACSSTSETSKGSGLSLSRSENRIKARERAREMAAKKEKESVNQVNSVSQSSSFTDLLNGGTNAGQNPAGSPESRTHWTTPMDYFFSRPPPPPQFNITAGDHHQTHPQHHFSFLQENFVPVATTTAGGGGGEIYNINFSIAGGGLAPGFSRGTLQSNLPSLMHHHHHLQRFQPSFADGSTSSGNLPFFMAPNAVSAAGAAADHFPASGYDDPRGLQLCYGGADGGVRHSDNNQKEKSKN